LHQREEEVFLLRGKKRKGNITRRATPGRGGTDQIQSGEKKVLSFLLGKKGTVNEGERKEEKGKKNPFPLCPFK